MSELHRINTNLLVALDALLREQSVTRAAAEAGITQSAMSNALAQLRAVLGDPLLVRSGRGMQPTPFAESLRGDLRLGIENLERVVKREREFVPGSSRERFMLALSDGMEAVLFPSLLMRLRELAPGLTIQVVPWGRLEPPERLAIDVDVSVGVRAEERELADRAVSSPLPTGVQAANLFDANLMTLVRPDHPRIRQRLTLKAFCECEHVLVTEQRDAAGILDEALAREGMRRRIAVRVPRHTLVGELIARTDLIATIDCRIAGQHGRTHGLRLMRPPVAVPRARYAMLWHERTHADPARVWLREQVLAVAASLDAGVRNR